MRKRGRRVCLILTISRPLRRSSFFSLCLDVMMSREVLTDDASVHRGVARGLSPPLSDTKRGREAPFVAAERRYSRSVRSGTCHPVVCELFHRLPWGMMKSCSFLATALWRSNARLLFPALFHDGVLSGSQGGLASGENGRWPLSGTPGRRDVRSGYERVFRCTLRRARSGWGESVEALLRRDGVFFPAHGGASGSDTARRRKAAWRRRTSATSLARLDVTAHRRDVEWRHRSVSGSSGAFWSGTVLPRRRKKVPEPERAAAGYAPS